MVKMKTHSVLKVQVVEEEEVELVVEQEPEQPEAVEEQIRAVQILLLTARQPHIVRLLMEPLNCK